MALGRALGTGLVTCGVAGTGGDAEKRANRELFDRALPTTGGWASLLLVGFPLLLQQLAPSSSLRPRGWVPSRSAGRSPTWRSLEAVEKSPVLALPLLEAPKGLARALAPIFGAGRGWRHHCGAGSLCYHTGHPDNPELAVPKLISNRHSVCPSSRKGTYSQVPGFVWGRLRTLTLPMRPRKVCVRGRPLLGTRERGAPVRLVQGGVPVLLRLRWAQHSGACCWEKASGEEAPARGGQRQARGTQTPEAVPRRAPPSASAIGLGLLPSHFHPAWRAPQPQTPQGGQPGTLLSSSIPPIPWACLLWARVSVQLLGSGTQLKPGQRGLGVP